MFPTSKKELALEIKNQVKDGGDLHALLNKHKLGIQTYNKWTARKSKKVRRARGMEQLPSIPTTIMPPTMIASPMCPPGYVMVMIPLSALANLIGG